MEITRFKLEAIRRNYFLWILIAIIALASISNLWSYYNGTFNRYVLCVQPCIQVDFNTGVILHTVFLVAGLGLTFPIFGFNTAIATVVFLGLMGLILLVQVIIQDPILTVIRYYEFTQFLLPAALLIMKITKPQIFWAMGFR